MTYQQKIIQDWVGAGVDRDLLQLNPEAIDREVEKELKLWINSFINSFRPENRLKDALERSFFMQTPALFSAPEEERLVGGLALKIRPTTQKDCKFLLSKRRQLYYRVLKLDPAITFLCLHDLQGIEALTINLSTREIFLSRTHASTHP